MADYRTALRAKGLRPMTAAARDRLRTNREPGDVEIVRDRRVEAGWRLHRYSHALLED